MFTPNVRFGSIADMTACLRDVRITPESGHQSRRAAFPLCGKSRLSWLTCAKKKDRADPPTYQSLTRPSRCLVSSAGHDLAIIDFLVGRSFDVKDSNQAALEP